MRSLLWRNIKATLLLPGVVAGIVPLSIGWVDPWRWAAGGSRFFGIVPLSFGLGIGLWAMWLFASRGGGTPAPWDPPKQLVTGGPYRFSRNPMYVCVPLMILGEALLFGSFLVLVYLALALVMFQVRIVAFEEPTLKREFGEQFERYCARVPRWIGRADVRGAATSPPPSDS